MKINKELKKGFNITLGIISCILLITILIFSVNAVISKRWILISNPSWQTVAQSSSNIESNTVISSISNRYLLTTSEKTAILFLNITDNLNRSFIIGAFELSYKIKTDIQSGQARVDVVYNVPQNWLIDNATDFNISGEFKMRNPPIKKEPARDPAFYRGKDYPESIPFDEIDLVTDFVSVYTDTNETEYNFRIKVIENSDYFNLRSLNLLIPEGESLSVE